MKKVCAAAFVLMFVATTATTSFAARVKCEVKEIKDDGTVVLDCGDDAGKFKEGDKLKISTPKGAAVEGC